jgi:NADPH:quinone reductase-like Zn-dependent oxidoreductase
LKLVEENLPLPLSPTSVLIKLHAVALNYRDANIANGGNPWPVLPNGILCNDAAGEIIAVGEKVKALAIGDRVGPIIDTDYISGREVGRSWLAADEDGVMADHIIFDEAVLCKLPVYLDWVSAATIPCAGVTAWSALKGMSIGQTVLIQGKFCLALVIYGGMVPKMLTCRRHRRCEYVCDEACSSCRAESCSQLVK